MHGHSLRVVDVHGGAVIEKLDCSRNFELVREKSELFQLYHAWKFDQELLRVHAETLRFPTIVTTHVLNNLLRPNVWVVLQLVDQILSWVLVVLATHRKYFEVNRLKGFSIHRRSR